MMKSKNIAISALFITFMTIGAFVKIPGPLLPMTLQTFFAVFGALLLKGKHILVSMSLYILIGLIGVPVFSEGGGIGYIIKPSFGFLIGFCIGAYIITCLVNKSKYTFSHLLLSSFIGLFVIYGIGLLYYFWISKALLQLPLSITKLLMYCFFLPLPGDIMSCILASILARRLRPIFQKIF